MKRYAILPALWLSLSAGAPPPETANKPAPVAKLGDVTITVTNLRNADGVVRACMTSTKKSFPKCRGVDGVHSATVKAHEGKLLLMFKDVRPGSYAIALLHDENANGKADRALGMMPREGFGFSRDAPVRMGPPKFDDAVFEVGGQHHDMTIKMRYML